MNKNIFYDGISLDVMLHFKIEFIKRKILFSLIFCCLASLFVSAQAGKDGALTVTVTNTVLNRYTKPTTDIAVGATTITVTAINELARDGNTYYPTGYTGPANTYANNLLTQGDMLMIYQAQGATISTANNIGYGSVTALNSAGSYELVRVASVAGNVITLSCATKFAYQIAGHVQIIRVPQYTTLTVNSGASVTTIPWGAPTFGGSDPSDATRRRGGFTAVIANSVANNGNINANVGGFRGGTIENLTSGPTANVFYSAWVTNDAAVSAEKGESIAGYRTDYDAIGGRYGRGAPANGGGGGNAHNAGGGGGANGGNINNWFRGSGVMVMSGNCTNNPWRLDPDFIANTNAMTTSSGGGRGGYTYGGSNQDACNLGPSYPAGAISATPLNPAADVSNTAWAGDRRSAMGGLGGRPINATTFQRRIIFGGGGGAGDGNNDANNDGGDGGGIVFLIVSSSITGTGNIQANGENAPPTRGGNNDAPGGGGGGGTVLITATSIVATQNITANGGAGGNQGTIGDESEGPGGGGGGGVIALNVIADQSTKTVSGGIFGTTASTALTEFPANGATRGNLGSVYEIKENIPVCGACYKPGATVGTALETKIGITALSRAGATNANWPMVRNGAHIALEAKGKGFVLTRIANPVTAITNPVDGMMVYDTTLNCLRVYTVDEISPANTGWKCFNSQTCPDNLK